MRIELKQPYKSIAALTTEELPDFAILIGRNGAGKTQILQSLKEGQSVIPGIGADNIELYDMGSFQTPNASVAHRQANQFARITADAYLLSPSDGKPFIKTAAAIFDQFANGIERESGVQARDDFERNLRDEIREVPDFAVFAAHDRGSPYKEALYKQVLAPIMPETTGRQTSRSSNRANNSFNANQAALLTAAMKLTGKLPHELTHDDIMRAAHYEGNTLSNSISAVFASYKVDQFIWAHKRIESEPVGFADLIDEYRAEYPPPWETLREIMSEMRDAAGDDGLFNFDFSDPDDNKLDMGNYEQFTFKAEMTNRTTGSQYELNSLSSGEQILMALCLASFNQYLGRRLPKLLLLDELDAVLHPSMVEALVKTLKTLFVSNGTKVLLTSHSPMTAAALDDADIFRVTRTGGNVEVSRTTKSEAISELSEGLATVDAGLRIAACDEAKVTILTEGHNTKHLKKWVELNFPKDVHVFEELEQHTSDSQLLGYGRLLGKMNTNTHFVVVWDCDAADKAEALRRELPVNAKVTSFAFAKLGENTITQRGIENNYEEEILKPFTFEKVDYDGKSLGRVFPADRKTEFADHVFQKGTSQYFTHFKGLYAIVSDVLEPIDEQPCANAAEH